MKSHLAEFAFLGGCGVCCCRAVLLSGRRRIERSILGAGGSPHILLHCACLFCSQPPSTNTAHSQALGVGVSMQAWAHMVWLEGSGNLFKLLLDPKEKPDCCFRTRLPIAQARQNPASRMVSVGRVFPRKRCIFSRNVQHQQTSLKSVQNESSVHVGNQHGGVSHESQWTPPHTLTAPGFYLNLSNFPALSPPSIFLQLPLSPCTCSLAINTTGFHSLDFPHCLRKEQQSSRGEKLAGEMLIKQIHWNISAPRGQIFLNRTNPVPVAVFFLAGHVPSWGLTGTAQAPPFPGFPQVAKAWGKAVWTALGYQMAAIAHPCHGVKFWPLGRWGGCGLPKLPMQQGSCHRMQVCSKWCWHPFCHG